VRCKWLKIRLLGWRSRGQSTCPWTSLGPRYLMTPQGQVNQTKLIRNKECWNTSMSMTVPRRTLSCR
jgi:hypothetical protein